jgi:hypothetical protein
VPRAHGFLRLLRRWFDGQAVEDELQQTATTLRAAGAAAAPAAMMTPTAASVASVTAFTAAPTSSGAASSPIRFFASLRSRARIPCKSQPDPER